MRSYDDWITDDCRNDPSECCEQCGRTPDRCLCDEARRAAPPEAKPQPQPDQKDV